MGEVERKLIFEVDGNTIYLVFRWEHGDWVCRMNNEFMEDLLLLQEG